MIKAADKLPQHHSKKWRDIDIVVEWPTGSVRIGEKEDGTPFKSEMKADYGYIPDTADADGDDYIDVYIGPDEDAEHIYAVEQLKDNGEFDEFKLMLGFPSLEDAETMYALHAGEERVGEIREFPFEELTEQIGAQQEKTAAVEKIKLTQAEIRKQFVRASPRHLECKHCHKTIPDVYNVARGHIEEKHMKDPNWQSLPLKKTSADEEAVATENPAQLQGVAISAEGVRSEVISHIDKLVQNEMIGPVEITNVLFTGSRILGSGRDDSDLDVIVFYTGDTREDDFFNAANGNPLIIGGVQVDINPIKADRRGELESAGMVEKTASKTADHDLIRAFVKNYEHEMDFYQEVASLVQDKLETVLQEAGIKAVVSSRAKRPKRLEKKLRRRESKKNYKTFRDIYDDIIDLAGARVALYMPKDREAVGRIIQQTFTEVRPAKHFPEDRGPGDAIGYIADHYLVVMRPESLRNKELRYADTQIEIQVASILMNAWAEVSHDLIYKPEKGKLTPEETGLLRDLNNIVQMGEKQLEKLQAAIESRNGEELRFDMTAALQRLADVSTLTMGEFRMQASKIAGLSQSSVAKPSKSQWVSYLKARLAAFKSQQ